MFFVLQFSQLFHVYYAETHYSLLLEVNINIAPCCAGSRINPLQINNTKPLKGNAGKVWLASNPSTHAWISYLSTVLYISFVHIFKPSIDKYILLVFSTLVTENTIFRYKSQERKNMKYVLLYTYLIKTMGKT